MNSNPLAAGGRAASPRGRPPAALAGRAASPRGRPLAAVTALDAFTAVTALAARAAYAARSPARRPRAALLVAAALGALGLAFWPTPAAPRSGPAGNPLIGLTRSADDGEPLVGRVVERLAAGSYTYVAIERDDGRRAWAVALGRGVPEGARVRVRGYSRKANFYSARLRRTFPELIFGSLAPAD